MEIKKYITPGGMTLEIGDFYGGGGDEEVITSMTSEGTNLHIITTSGYYDLTLKPGDYIVDTESSGHLVKLKTDKDD